MDVFRAQSLNGKYLSSLRKLILEAESRGGPHLRPSIISNIAIKIKTKHAPGLQVSSLLVDALLDILSTRGYKKNQIFLVDRDELSLARAGFSSPRKVNNLYQGYEVISSHNPNYFNPTWLHDSPMPPTIHDRARFFLQYPLDRLMRVAEERKSYLPSILFLNDVFWINLSVAMDHLSLGIEGASANMTTGAISNHQRFLNKPTLAPATVAEILAIPELWESRLYSIMDLTQYQFANSGKFDAEFLGRESTLLLSENPLSVDRAALSVLTTKRKELGFIERKSEELLLFQYAKELGLGDALKAKVYNVQ
ncbi:MAG: hypothetical protein P8P49_06970 [Opitutales bacterium]|nr:hypothetical protein [Opitutales bacterium]MDG1325492.1 hypothetical protein [Opitutales bacterium]